MKLILHDLDSQYDSLIRNKCDRALAADGKYAPCRGCFGCRTKHPAECFIKDSPHPAFVLYLHHLRGYLLHYHICYQRRDLPRLAGEETI